MRELCVDCAWAVCGLCVGCEWAVCGLCVGCAWAVRGPCVGCAWAVRGLCVGCAWAVRGLALPCIGLDALGNGLLDMGLDHFEVCTRMTSTCPSEGCLLLCMAHVSLVIFG